MMTIPDITKDPKLNDLFDVSNCALHVQYLTDNITELRTYEALQMTRFYEPWFKQHRTFASMFPLQYQQLMDLIIDNKWIALLMLPQSETIELLQAHVLALFTMSQRRPFSWDYADLPDFTLGEQMRVNCLRIADLDARDNYKVRLAVALKTNQEVITSAPFFANIKQTSPTLAAWFQEYLRAIGPHANSSNFLLSEFLHKSEPGQLLNAGERHRLELIFQLYHRLTRSSWTIEGIEEKFTIEGKDQIGVLQYGEIIPYDKETMATLKQIQIAELNAVSETELHRPPVERVGTQSVTPDSALGPNVDATKGPDYFSEQDEAEIKLHQKLLPATSTTQNQYVEQVSQLKQQLQLTFKSDEEEKRFTDLLMSVLRGVRDITEFQQSLTDLSYPANQVITITAAARDLIHSNQGTIKKRSTNTVDSSAAKKPTLQQIPGKPMTSAEAAALTAAAPTETVEPTTPIQNTQPIKSFLPKLRRSRITKKPLIDDVKLQPSMMMGPIDELRAMDVLEFRRLSPNPTQAALHLKDKIDLLAEESVSQQADGIQAFKASPLNTMYLELGNQSITSGQAVTDLIVQLEARGTPTLDVAEFNAIADLNKQLRF